MLTKQRYQIILDLLKEKKKLRVVISELFLFRYVRWLIPLGWCR